jgi:hypothetical protein
VIGDILLFPQTASVEILRTTVKGFVDVLRVGDRLDEIWNNSTGAWKDINDGNISDAGKKILAVGLDSFTEVSRALDLVLIGGAVKSVIGTGVEIVSTEVADFVGRLLLRSDAEAESLLWKLFNNLSLKNKFKNQTKNIDDVARAFKKGYLSAEDIEDFRILRNSDDVNAEIRANALTRNPDNLFHDSYKVGTNPIERVTVQSEQYVRFYRPESNGISNGFWLVKRSEVEGLTPLQIKGKLGLQFEPTHVVDVNVPSGIKLRQGIVEEIPEFGVQGGANQTQLLEKIDPSNYANERTIGDAFS